MSFASRPCPYSGAPCVAVTCNDPNGGRCIFQGATRELGQLDSGGVGKGWSDAPNGAGPRQIMSLGNLSREEAATLMRTGEVAGVCKAPTWSSDPDVRIALGDIPVLDLNGYRVGTIQCFAGDVRNLETAFQAPHPVLCVVGTTAVKVTEEAAKFLNGLAERGLSVLGACLLIDEMTLIHKLREPEGSTVTVFCDNADFGVGKANGIEVCDDWTEWREKRFIGDTLLEALSAAEAARSQR